jgi:hypothetical protein
MPGVNTGLVPVSTTRRFAAGFVVFWLFGGLLAPGAQGTLSKVDRDLYRQMLADVRKDVEKNYYDPAFRGIDLAAVFKEAGEKVAAAESTADAIDVITNTLFQFGDSHTRFYPPPRRPSLRPP